MAHELEEKILDNDLCYVIIDNDRRTVSSVVSMFVHLAVLAGIQVLLYWLGKRRGTQAAGQ